jgi:hypothetical protein
VRRYTEDACLEETIAASFHAVLQLRLGSLQHILAGRETTGNGFARSGTGSQMVSGARKVFLFGMTREALLVARVAGASLRLRWIDDKRKHSGESE